jgi:hypothetical protein
LITASYLFSSKIDTLLDNPELPPLDKIISLFSSYVAQKLDAISSVPPPLETVSSEGISALAAFTPPSSHSVFPFTCPPKYCTYCFSFNKLLPHLAVTCRSKAADLTRPSTHAPARAPAHSANIAIAERAIESPATAADQAALMAYQSSMAAFHF